MSEGFIRTFFVGLLAVLAASVAAAQGNYRIQSGDTLSIEVLEDPALNRNALVLPDGSISFPLVGTVRAGGRTVPQVQQALAAGLAPNFAAPPNVFVSVDTLADRGALLRRELLPGPVIDIYIMGEIVNPGKLEAVPGTTILQILAQAGGLTEFAAERRIELRRTDRANRVVKTYLFSYSGRGKGTRISGSTRLAPGDVIVVPERRLFE